MTDRKYTPAQVETIIQALRPGDTITVRRWNHPEAEATMTCWETEAGSLYAGIDTLVRDSFGSISRTWTADNSYYVLTSTSRDPFTANAANLPIGSVVGIRNESGIKDANVKMSDNEWQDTGGDTYEDRSVQGLLDRDGYTVISHPDVAVQEDER